ncbi:MAG: hypothetical protein ACKVVT_02435 [Dehalococcoidia bacterium]
MTRLTDLRACCWSTISATHEAIAEVQGRSAAWHGEGASVVSCQRTEAYGFGPCDCPAPLHLHGAEALFHLAEVAAGLHAVVLGEAQILGQVRAGFASATAGLRRYADVALRAARELRRETDFNSHAGALLDRGLRLAPHVGRETVCVLGAGPMGHLIAKRAQHLGFRRIVVASRTPPAWAAGMECVSLTRVAQAGAVDVVAGCLGSAAGVRAENQLPLAALYLDLGTPRNFNLGPQATLVTLADLFGDEERRPHAVKRRRQLRAVVRRTVQTRLAALRDEDDPVRHFRREVDRVRQVELARALRLHPDLNTEAAERLSRALTNKLLHETTAALRADPRLAETLAGLLPGLERAPAQDAVWPPSTTKIAPLV